MPNKERQRYPRTGIFFPISEAAASVIDDFARQIDGIHNGEMPSYVKGTLRSMGERNSVLISNLISTSMSVALLINRGFSMEEAVLGGVCAYAVCERQAALGHRTLPEIKDTIIELTAKDAQDKVHDPEDDGSMSIHDRNNEIVQDEMIDEIFSQEPELAKILKRQHGNLRSDSAIEGFLSVYQVFKVNSEVDHLKALIPPDSTV